MKRIPESGVFMPASSRIEAKSDATTRAAKEIIQSELSARIAKTERLRLARLAREAEQIDPVVKTVRKKR